MRRTFLPLVLFLLLALPASALALGQADAQTQSSTDVPQGELLESQIAGDSRFSFTALDDETFEIRIDRKKEGQWVTEALNSSIKPWNGYTPALSIGSGSTFYLKYSDVAYAIISRDLSGTWRLTAWSVSLVLDKDFYLGISPHTVSIYTQSTNQAYPKKWLHGSPVMAQELSALDTSRLPTCPEEIGNLIDPEGWAVISSAGGTGEQNLYPLPDASTEPFCTLYDWAPVRIIETKQDWAQVAVANLVGWVPQASLLAGMDMLDVDQRFSELRVLQESLTDEAAIQALPDTGSPVLYFAKNLDSSVFNYLFVMGCTPDGWYLVFNPDGIHGFMESRWFFAGNG